MPEFSSVPADTPPMHSNDARRNAVAAATAGPTLVLRHLRTVETRALLSQKKLGTRCGLKINVQNSDMAATILTILCEDPIAFV